MPPVPGFRRRQLGAGPNAPMQFAQPIPQDPAFAKSVFINGIPVINNLDMASQYAAAIDSWEVITQSLYDSAAYPTTGIANLLFFQNQVGAGTSVISGNPKTLEDTNMPSNGMLPNLTAFVMTSIELDVQTDIAFAAAANPAVFGAQAVASQVNDMWIIRATGYLKFTIMSKPYLEEGPLMKFPASNDLEIDAAAADASSTGADLQTRIAWAKSVGPAYTLAPNNLLLIPMQSFKLLLAWDTLQPITSQARIFARLMGQMMRAAQ